MLYTVVVVCLQSEEYQEYEYLLKWKGYGEEENSWVLASGMNCWDLLQAYLGKNVFVNHSSLSHTTTTPVALPNSASSSFSSTKAKVHSSSGSSKVRARSKAKLARSKQPEDSSLPANDILVSNTLHSTMSKGPLRLHLSEPTSGTRRMSSVSHQHRRATEKDRVKKGAHFSTPKHLPSSSARFGEQQQRPKSASSRSRQKVKDILKQRKGRSGGDFVLTSPSVSPLLSSCDDSSSLVSDGSFSVDDSFRLHLDSDEDSNVSGNRLSGETPLPSMEQPPVVNGHSSRVQINVCFPRKKRTLNGLNHSVLQHHNRVETIGKSLLPNGHTANGKKVVLNSHVANGKKVVLNSHVANGKKVVLNSHVANGKKLVLDGHSMNSKKAVLNTHAANGKMVVLNGHTPNGKKMVLKKKNGIVCHTPTSTTQSTATENSSDSESWSKRRLRKRAHSSSPTPSLELILSSGSGSGGHAEVSSTTSSLNAKAYLTSAFSLPPTPPPQPALLQTVQLSSPTTAPVSLDPVYSQPLIPNPEYQQELLEWQFMLNQQCRKSEAFILVENRIDQAPIPWSFKYITSNLYGEGVPNPQSAEVGSMVCGCNCYLMGKKCSPKNQYCCPKMAGAEFPYSLAGKIRLPPGNPIYECNSRCNCPQDCINRIVQCGRKINMCIFRTPNGRGWGVKTMEPIKPNTFVTEYVGEVVTTEEAERRGELYDQEGRTYLFDLDFNCDDNPFTIDAAHYGNISHFFNHSCNPNLRVYSVWIDTLDERLPRIAFFSTQSISTGQELTFDYQMNQDEQGQVECLCGEANCCGYLY
jgi:histone-lysine N-methyltransferase SUV39H